MTFEEILATVREKSAEIDATGTDFLAVQVNLTGEGDIGKALEFSKLIK